MHKITGSYSQNGKRIAFKFNLPQNWDELYPMQTAFILQTLGYTKADIYTLKTSILALILGDKNFRTLANMNKKDVFTLFNTIDWVFTTRPPATNKFPILKINKQKHLAPANSLSNICFGEWCFAYEFYLAYHKTNDIIFLNKLIASLYRLPLAGISETSESYKGDLRQPFNENHIEPVAKQVASIAENIKLTILTWFTSAILQVMERRTNTFPNPNFHSEQSEETKPTEPNQSNRTWLTVFRELLGPKFGTQTQLKHTNAFFILDYLEEQHIAYEEARKTLQT